MNAKDGWGKARKKCEEGGNCSIKISATVRVHKPVHTMGVYWNKVQDCAGKSIFSLNHILIIAYGQIALLLASINPVWQVSNAYIGGENFFGPCATVSQRLLFVSEEISDDQHQIIITSTTQVRNAQHQLVIQKVEVCVYYVMGPCACSAGPPQNLLHIKNGHFGCFVNQNQPAPPPGGPALRLSCRLKTQRLYLNT